MRLVSSLLLVVGVLFGISGTVHAQSAAGDIRGVVVDPAGAMLPGVTITVANTATGAEREVVTDSSGRFATLTLPVGPYEVTARLQGFASRRQEGLRVLPGTTTPLRMELTRAALPDTINVGGVPAVIDAARSSQSSVITTTAIENLPLVGRDVLDLVTLVPGSTRHVGSGEFSFAGQREPLSGLVIDGLDASDTLFGRSLSRPVRSQGSLLFPLDAVEAIRVDNTAYSAESARAGAGLVSIVTRTGSNQFTGSAYDFYRDDGLSANPLLNDDRGLDKDPFHANQFGGVIGGPIRRGSHFFFVAYEGQRGTATDRSLALSAPQDPAALSGTTFAFAFSGPLTAGVERRVNTDVLVARTDHQFTGRHRLTFRYDDQQEAAARAADPELDPFFGSERSPSYRRSFNLTASTLLGRAIANEIRLQYSRDRALAEPAVFNRLTGFPRQGLALVDIGLTGGGETTQARTQVADTLSWPAGAHLFKAGVDLEFDDVEDRSLLGDAVPGSGLAAGFAPASTNRRDLAFFVQDSWQLRPSTTLNAGLRYDQQEYPVAAGNSLALTPRPAALGFDTTARDVEEGNWGPHVGAAWAPAGARHVVRGGYGVFYGRPAAVGTGVLAASSAANLSGRALTPLTPTIGSGGLIAGFLGGAPRMLVDGDFRAPRVQQASGSFEWEWMPYTLIGVMVMHVRADHLPRATDSGAVSPFPSVLRVMTIRSDAESRYNGLAVELHRRFAQTSYYQLSYTLGKVMDTGPAAASTIPGPFDDQTLASVAAPFTVDRASGNNDQRHHFVGSIVYLTNQFADARTGIMRALLSNWTLSAIFRVQSGPRYSAYVSSDLNRDLNLFNDVAPDTTRNEFSLPMQTTLDGRLARAIPTGGRTRLSLMLEVFNARNQPNYTGVNNILYTVNPASPTTLVNNPLFGEYTAQDDPRTIQLAARFTF